MCVIAASPIGAPFPNEELRRDMWDYNDDGMGFMYTLDKRVYLSKGFLTYLDSERALALLEKDLKKRDLTFDDISIALHYRIGTHGPNNEGLTHPFPISNRYEHLTALDLTADTAMMHNGVIHTVTAKKDWSDTQQYIADILVPLAKHDIRFYRSNALLDLIENTIDGSRFAFLDKYGDFTLVGNWVESSNQDLKGIKFSNLNHEYTPSYSRYYSSGYLGGWSSGYEEANETTIWAAPVPVGSKVASYFEIDVEYQPISTVRTVTESQDELYWVDYIGEVYIMDNYGILRKSATLDVALSVDDDGVYTPLSAGEGELQYTATVVAAYDDIKSCKTCT